MFDARVQFFLENINAAFIGDYDRVVYLLIGPAEEQYIVNEGARMPIWGDRYTRVRWVYTGDSNLAEEIWYR